MTGHFDFRLIILSMLVAFVTSLSTLILSAKVYKSKTSYISQWQLLGALTIGTGLWSTFFIGMLAYSLPIPVSFSFTFALFAWAIAVSIAWLILKITSQSILPNNELIQGGILAGTGIILVPYFIMNAIRILPPIAYNKPRILASIIISMALAMIALRSVSWLRSKRFEMTLVTCVSTSLLMTLSIELIHFTSISAAVFSPWTVSLSQQAMNPNIAALIVALFTTGLILGTFVFALTHFKIGKENSLVSIDNKESSHDESRMAMIDSLTHLPNRRFFQHHLELSTQRNRMYNTSLAVAFIDLDGFKNINDSYGHHVGDELLIAVASRLNSAIRDGDLVARLGGDEFVAVIENVITEKDVVPVVERIVQSIREVFYIQDQSINISTSVGVAMSPRDGEMSKLLMCADTAMYRAKSDGKNQFRFYDSEIELASDRLLEMQRDLQHALNHREFKLNFHPKVDGLYQSLIGLETLIRWEHPQKGDIPPNIFIPAAESLGLINKIGNWVIEETCRIQSNMRKLGIDLTISINLSSQQFRNENLVDDILSLLSAYNLPKSALMFEFNEFTAMHSSSQFKTILNDFKLAGIQVAMDDFGTGYSSLQYLHTIDVSEVKLDRHFVKDIVSNLKTRSVIGAIVQLAHTLGLIVVAEGVETEEQRMILTELGCDQLQGYLFAQPVSEENLVDMLDKINSATKLPLNVIPFSSIK